MNIIDKGESIKNINGGRHFKNCIRFAFNIRRMDELKEYVSGIAGPIKKKWRFHIVGMPHKNASYEFGSQREAYISFADKRYMILFKLGWEECTKTREESVLPWAKLQKGQLAMFAGGRSCGKTMLTPRMMSLPNASDFYFFDYESSYPSVIVDEMHPTWLDLWYKAKPIAGVTLVVPKFPDFKPSAPADFGNPSNSANECLPWVNRKSAPLG
jgi:hypothetical protein